MKYQNILEQEKVSEVKKDLSAENESQKNGKSYIIYNIIKRIFDFFSSLILSVIILIPCLIIALVILIIDKGNPFYMHERIGKNGKTIRILKFRSMKKHSGDLKDILTDEQYEQYKREFKVDNDPRLLPHGIGSFIRKTSIDELPQLLNIIKGDLSVIGPRPIVRKELESKYTAEEQEKLLSVKPGLTGYWQAYARNNAGYTNGERQRMELYYVDNRGIWMDIKILFQSIVSVLKRDGAQ